MSRGFTLIETIVYIALLGLLMAGVLGSVYQLLEGGASLNTKTTVQDEGNFVLRKIDWALTGALTVFIPNASELSITKYDGTTVDIQLSAGAVLMQANGTALLPITTGNVVVSNVQFQLIGSNPLGVIATTTINGIDFVTKKYIRK